MAFAVHRSPSPTLFQDDEPVSLHPISSFSQLPEHDPSSREKERSHIDIVLDDQYLTLKGTGPDVEPTRLSGHVALFLTEATSLKEITLQFRGKARIPVQGSDSSMTYIVCNHEWSFLEGDKKHTRTLKAGQHFFPFQLQIGGSLPSTITTSSFGGASVAYKLRALVVRPALSHNFEAVAPVYILRGFSPEALEYLQTLEIENTWPDKLMYSIIVPHKAWAAGDRLTAIIKLSPLAKGVSVGSVATHIMETTKIYSRGGSLDDTRQVASTKHDIINGKAVEVPLDRPRFPQVPNRSISNLTQHHPSDSSHITSHDSDASHSTFISQPSSRRPSPPPSIDASTTAEPSTQLSTSSSSANQQNDEGYSDLEDSSDVVTFIGVIIPTNAVTPTHGLEPINVSHRIRWNIFITNLDGHISELRCSLPIHILDARFLAEARVHTSATRRLLLGSSEIPLEEESERELPSYNAHVRDRVANMFLPDAQTIRVSNPWVTQGTSPVQHIYDQVHVVSLSHPQSGYATPLDAHVHSHLPHAPGSGESTPLDWVNSELLLSLGNPDLMRAQSQSVLSTGSVTPPIESVQVNEPGSAGSRSRSRRGSRAGSRVQSRAGSPERRGSTEGGATGASGSMIFNPPLETYVHHSHASRGLHTLLKATMRPFTALSHPLSHLNRAHHHQHHPSSSSASFANGSGNFSASSLPQSSASPGSAPLTLVPLPTPDGNALLHRAFTEVPDYSIASRGFIGGVPPLESMRGLPSYEESAASMRRGELRSMSVSELSVRSGAENVRPLTTRALTADHTLLSLHNGNDSLSSDALPLLNARPRSSEDNASELARSLGMQVLEDPTEQSRQLQTQLSGHPSQGTNENRRPTHPLSHLNSELGALTLGDE